MPTTPYMVVDPRLDHSIRIPRPDLTVSLGIPNACTGCHHDEAKGQTAAWAESQVAGWYGERRGPPHFAHAIAAGRQGKPEGPSLLDAVCRRKDVSAMVRASALVLLSHYGSHAVEAAACEAVNDPEELVRAAAARSLQELRPDSERVRRLRPLLHDPVRAVRTEAARVLSSVPREAIPEKDLAAFDASLKEYMDGQRAVDDQPAAHLCLGVVHANQGERAEAEKDYQTALRLDPAFIPARVNLAMLYNEQDRKVDAEREYRQVIEREPKLAEAYYSLGLLVAEDSKRLAEAAKLLTKATELAPQNSRMHYNRGLALQNLGRVDEAEQALLAARKLAPQAVDYVYALAILNIQQKRWDRAALFADELQRLDPRNPQWREVAEHVRNQRAKGSPKK
jgi:Flp pilus assembly protein TadD